MSVIPRDPIPLQYFGRSHWSVLGFLEECAVKHAGQVPKDKMRTDPVRHGAYVDPEHRDKMREIMERALTWLANGAVMEDHDDWDCAGDLAAAGLLAVKGAEMYPMFELTDPGYIVAHSLRRHLARGGVLGNFRCPLTLARIEEGNTGGDNVVPMGKPE